MKLIIEIDLDAFKENQINQTLWTIDKVTDQINRFNTLKGKMKGEAMDKDKNVVGKWRVE